MAQSNKAALILYRSLLTSHRTSLPTHLRTLGDSYVKSEFRLHAKLSPGKPDDKKSIDRFMKGWVEYLNHVNTEGRKREIARTTASSVTEGSLGEEESKWGVGLSIKEVLTDEQKEQLGKLREEAVRQGRGETKR